MRPAQPNGDTAPSSNSNERATSGAESRISEVVEGPRRRLAQDGLHLGSSGDERTPSKELQARERLLLALVSSARHEVRSPLQSIQGFAELLAAESYGTLGEEQRVFVEHIIQSGLDLSRAVDACFELVQLELHPESHGVSSVQLRQGLEDALRVAQAHTSLTLEGDFEQIGTDMFLHTDALMLNKAVGAVVTGLAPLMRGKLCISCLRRESTLELLFGPPLGEARIVWRTLSDVSRRNGSARALLWLRLASVLFERAGARLETSEGYDRVRVLLPLLT